MTDYHVTAKRWAHGWELHVDGVGVTQSRTLATADRQVRDYLSLMLDLEDASTLPIRITPEIGGTLEAEVRRAREAVASAERAQSAAAAASRKVTRDLRSAGLTGADAAAVLGVSPQRVSQLNRA